jgi:hypothetical protein
MRTPGAALAAGSLLLLTATAAYAEPVRPGEEATFDLGILPPSTPDVLKAAATAPYVAPDGADCAGIAQEIAALDAVLGPDADAPRKGGRDTGKLVGQAVKSLIPYRSVVRFVTGADRKQRERDQAAMAGWARRGYLKGLQASQNCPGATAAPMVAAIKPDAGLVPAAGTEAASAQPAAPLISPPLPAPRPAAMARVGEAARPIPVAVKTTISR